jgi:hypothetical protein
MKVILIASLLVLINSTFAFDSQINLTGLLVNDEQQIHQIAEVAQMIIADDTKEVEMVEFNNGNIYYGEEISGWALQSNKKPTFVIPTTYNGLNTRPSLKDYLDQNGNGGFRVPTGADLDQIIIDMNGRFGGDGSGGG